MKEIKFPLLTNEDIECRIGQVSKDNTKASLLLYQDARCGMKYLDQVVGAGKWTKRYYEVRGLVICSLGIYDDETNQFIYKDDTGSAGSIEEEKSIISDSFKRCCVCWGLARELYTAPDIWVKIESKYDKFDVKEIGYNDKKEIIKLVIVNRKTKEVVYSYGTSNKVPTTAQNQERTANSKKEEENTKQFAIDMKYIDDYYKLCNERQKGTLLDYIKKVSNYNSIAELFNDNIWTNRVAEALRKANNK